MARSWTAAQLAAMETNNKSLLISAAAGSGKTATLTERIIRKICDENDPADISRLLIVTFTRSAAAELRTRIFKALSDALANDPENSVIERQLVKLGSAKISTIDSFYLDIVRSHFSELGISSGFKITGTDEIYPLMSSIMNDTIEYFYDTDPAFPNLCECLTKTRDTKKLAGILLSLRTSLQTVPEGIDYLRQNAARLENEADLDFFSTSYGIVIREDLLCVLEYYVSFFDSAVSYIGRNETFSKSYGRHFDYIKAFVDDLYKTMKEGGQDLYRKTKDAILAFNPPRIGSVPSTEMTEELAAIRDTRKEILDALKIKQKARFGENFLLSEDSIKRSTLLTSRYTLILYRLMAEFERRLLIEKKQRATFDFNDIKSFAQKLLVDDNGEPTDIARSISELYDEIYIDEYQDVDNVQDLIFRSISKENNRFMVGDIKQSIYSFRGADPDMFSRYRERFPLHGTPEAEASDSETIFMSENFRCDRNVISFTNKVCSRLFIASGEKMNYRPEDDLVYMKNETGASVGDVKVKIPVIVPHLNETHRIELIEKCKYSHLTNEQAEAYYVAREIYRLIRNENKADGTPILPGDIAVLCQYNSHMTLIAEMLSKFGIPTSDVNREDIFQDHDVLLVLSVLNTVDNPHRDIYLAGTLYSPLFDFSMDDLIAIRLEGIHKNGHTSLYDALCDVAKNKGDLPKRCKAFIKALDAWRTSAASLPIGSFLRSLYTDDRFIAAGLSGSSSLQGGKDNLLLLYECARGFEQGSFKGVYEFISYINEMREKGTQFISPEKKVYSDKVNLMTIHQSKGLEFPVCFVYHSTINLIGQKMTDSLLFSYPLGIALKLSVQNGLALVNTPMRSALLRKISTDTLEEKMRLLYVALTRARERLYVTGVSRTSAEKLKEASRANIKYDSRFTVLDSSSMLTWVLDAAVSSEDRGDADDLELEFVCKTDLPLREYYIDSEIKKQTKRRSKETDEDIEIEPDEELLASLKKKFAFKYRYRELRRIPAKLSVSKLSPDILDENDTSLKLESAKSSGSAPVPDFFLEGGASKASAAERGTATHLFLQFCDHSFAESRGVKEEIGRLVERQFIPKNTAELIYEKELEAFFKSEFFEMIRKAKRVIRERRFNLLLPAHLFSAKEKTVKKLVGEKLAVQGVIDLILIDENDDILLFDYKTDRLKKAELADTELARKKMNEVHGLQLSYYAHAVKELFGKAPSLCAVYSTHAARLYSIDVQELSLPESLL